MTLSAILMEHPQPNQTINKPKGPLDNLNTTMSVSVLPPYANYDLNILCGPYAQPFFVHFFLGDVPKVINYEDPYDIPSWAGQNYIMPMSPARASQAATAQASPSGYTREASEDSRPLSNLARSTTTWHNSSLRRSPSMVFGPRNLLQIRLSNVSTSLIPQNSKPVMCESISNTICIGAWSEQELEIVIVSLLTTSPLGCGL